MKKISVVKQFEKFLNENKCLDIFLHNYYSDENCSFIMSIGRYFKVTPPRDLIIYAFHWGDGIKSYEFWSELSFKWIDKLNEKEIKAN